MSIEIKVHPAIIAACIMGTVLVSGLGKMNIIHHEEVPFQLIENQVVIISKHWYGDKVDIRMDSEIDSQESVRAIIKVLQEAGRLDTITFHLAGYGGNVETVFNLIDNVQSCLGRVIMIVEAPVYSGHAYLALAGDRLVMRPYSSLMLHTSSAYGEDCSKQDGYDRKVSNTEHCYAFMDTHFKLINKFLLSIDYKVMSIEEKSAVMNGHDFYLTADEYNQRVNQ